MDRSQAEENIQLIREVMERSARYTHFSGISGVLSGMLALIGCALTYSVAFSGNTLSEQIVWYYLIWFGVLVGAIAQDLIIAQSRAKRSGSTIWLPATYQALKAVFPGVFVAFVFSLVLVSDGVLDLIPAVWALGYGAALCAAGLFSIREVWIYGVVQLVTGAVTLLVLSQLAHNGRLDLVPSVSFAQLALSFGVYQIAFGLCIGWKHRKK